MRKTFIGVIIPMMLAGRVLMTAGDVPEATGRKKAGRVLSLKEVMRIKDGRNDYYFKSPRDIRIAPDGCIFIVDDDQFLKFSPEGRFLKNLYKKGQGPGELEGIKDYLITDDALVILQLQPEKLMLITHDGELISELRPNFSTAKLFAVHNDQYVTARYSIPEFDAVGKESSFIQVEWTLGYIDGEGGAEETEPRFPTRWYTQRVGGGAFADHIADFIAVPYRNEALILCHAEEYGLKLFDLARKRVVKEFGRKYRRVRATPDESGKIEIRPGISRFAPPVRYANDVQQVFVRGEEIWVMTSTIEPHKGVLIDVFDSRGEYVDHFYLPIQSGIKPEGLEEFPLVFRDDFVFMAEYDEDGIPAIVKYRITPQP